MTDIHVWSKYFDLHSLNIKFTGSQNWYSVILATIAYTIA